MTLEQHLENAEWIKEEPYTWLAYREQLGHVSCEVFNARPFEEGECEALVRRMHACLTYCRGISTETLEISNRERKS
jgi:hypothetical protein